jgi:hypothetical protein
VLVFKEHGAEPMSGLMTFYHEGAAKSGRVITGADVTAAFRAWNAVAASGV